MNQSILINKDLIFLDLEVSTNQELLSLMSENMRQHGLVHETFSDAIIKRERKYATGLPIDSFSVAIPHTDSIHVIRDSMSVAILKNPVPFKMMGTEDVNLEVTVVFMLAIKNSENQVVMLQSLIELFQNVKIMKNLKNSVNKTALLKLLNENVELLDEV